MGSDRNDFGNNQKGGRGGYNDNKGGRDQKQE
jgi:hypothetical protein